MDQLPEPDRKRDREQLSKALFNLCIESLIEKGELVPVGKNCVKLRTDATPAELPAAACVQLRSRLRLE
jgi:hypothetical protein